MVKSSVPARNVELRKAHRYRLAAPVFYYWAPQNGPTQSGQGTVRDINTSGAYILSDETLPVGALIQLNIMLPKLTHAGSGMQLTGEGVVLRVDSSSTDPNERGFAVSVQFYPEASEKVIEQFKSSARVA